MSDAPEKPRSRREVLLGIGLGAGAVAALPLALREAEAADGDSPQQSEVRQRYQLNDWIERYYALNRL